MIQGVSQMVALYTVAAGLIQEHAAEASGGPLTVEGGLMIWTVGVFLALLLVLKRFAWPAILGAVEAREQALEAQLAQAKHDREEAAALLAEHKRLVADARHQATSIVAEARSVTEKERALAVEKTKQEQDELLARARREIAAERDRAVADLRREAVDVSLAAAAKLVGSRLDSETDRRIVSEYLSTLDART
jgi:F-type H+-transporting ATPase subunit b